MNEILGHGKSAKKDSPEIQNYPIGSSTCIMCNVCMLVHAKWPHKWTCRKILPSFDIFIGI